MMISSTGLYSTSTYSYQVNTDSNSMQGQRPDGPPPPQEPQVDLDGSNTWDIDELEELATSLSEEDGDSFDAEEVLSTYDTNENGVIDEDEMSVVKDDDAFNLSNMQSVMTENAQGTMPPPPPPEDEELSVEALSSAKEEDEADLLAETLKKIQEAKEAAEEAAKEDEEEEDDDEFEKLTMRLLSKASSAYNLQASYASYLQSSIYEADAI